MSDSAEKNDPPPIRCTRCDTLNQATQTQCAGCGLSFSAEKMPSSIKPANTQLPAAPKKTVIDQIFPIAACVLAIVAIWLGIRLQQQEQTIVALTLPPTATATPIVTPSLTPSLTPIPQPTSTTTQVPTSVPTATNTPLPTPTLEPPYEHTIANGEAMFNIALRYRVSIDSIVAMNEGLSPDTIVAGQVINVPRPTATPPLTAVEVVFNGETLIADPTDCVMHEIQSADTYSGIAGRFDVPLDALLRMNRLSSESILQPGDRVCIPTVTIALTSIDAAGGAASFSAESRPAIQPQLLYPPAQAQLTHDVITLQWIADRDLAANEWYMVEVTNLSDVSMRPFRGFVQQTSFQIPDEMISAESTYRWRVSYVLVSGERSDGEFIYAFGGPSSESRFSVTP